MLPKEEKYVNFPATIYIFINNLKKGIFDMAQREKKKINEGDSQSIIDDKRLKSADICSTETKLFFTNSSMT